MTNPQAGGLKRKLTLTSMIVFGLMYMSPGVVVSTFGVVSEASHGAVASAYLVGTVAMVLTALSYAKMARRHITSGSVYTYAREELGGKIGFMSGWMIMLDYFFLPMVIWLITALWMNAMIPAIPVWGWLVINAIITTVVNGVGVVLADRVNKTFLIISLISLAMLVVVLVPAITQQPIQNAGLAFWNPDTSVGAITAGAAIAAYSFLGFDAISTMTEEVKDAKRNVPRAIVLTVILAGALFTVLALMMQWVHPGGEFENAGTAGREIAEAAGGTTFMNVFSTLKVIAAYATALTIQAGSSRLLFAMGRDGVLPKKVFGRLSPRFGTPVAALVVIACTAVIATQLDLDLATSFINFGAFLSFTVVNICVIVAAVRMRRNGERASIFGWFVLPALAGIVDIYLLFQLSGIAKIIGVCWLVLGVIVLAFLTRGFKQEPPRMSAEERKSIEQPVPAEA